MDEGIAKSITLGIVAFIVLAVAGVTIYMFNKGKSVASAGAANMDVLVKQLEDSKLADYPDGQTIQGSYVVSAVKNLSKDDFGVRIVTKLNASGTLKGGRWYFSATAYNETSPTSQHYVQGTQLFKVRYERNDNDALIGITFIQQGVATDPTVDTSLPAHVGVFTVDETS